MRNCLSVFAALGLLTIVSANSMAAPTEFPAVVVTSLDHSYVQEGGGYYASKDYFNILDGTGSATTVPFVTDLSTADTMVSVRIAAPTGKKFVFTVPGDATFAKLEAWIAWTSGMSSPGQNVWMPDLTFEGLSGTAPTTPSGVTWNGRVGADYLQVSPYLPRITQSFEFTALRIDFDVPAGGFSSSLKAYNVQNASFSAYASGIGMTDQAILAIEDISVVPAPGAMLLVTLGAGLVSWAKRRKAL